jgi:CRP-like cAMP-binding protein
VAALVTAATRWTVRFAHSRLDSDHLTTGEREQLAAVLRALGPVPEDSLERALDEFSVRTLKPGHHLLRAGQRAHTIAYVVSGLLREYYVSSDGSEHVRAFSTEGQFTGSLYDLLSQKPALVSVEALEPSRLLVTEWEWFQARCDREPVWNLVARHVAEGLYVRKAIREHEMLALTASERWETFRRDLGTLENRISQRHLASYLGITPEHLSRIRAAATRRRRK